MRLLDLFCGAGGASVGYSRAGFDEIVGVDIKPQPRYPFDFVQEDALSFPLEGFDVIHASPPCQRWTNAQKIRGRDHPDLITPTRERLKETGVPWVIENVPGAPLRGPMLLCGQMFGLNLYRHRLFELWHSLSGPRHVPHVKSVTKMGRPPLAGTIMQVVGNFSGVTVAREAMGIDWMTRDELREAVPPAYTDFIARQIQAWVFA